MAIPSSLSMDENALQKQRTDLFSVLFECVVPVMMKWKIIGGGNFAVICFVNSVSSITNEARKPLQKILKVFFLIVNDCFCIELSNQPTAVFACPVCCQSEERTETWEKIPPPTRPKPPEEFISTQTWRPSTKICALLQELHRMWKDDPEEKAIVFSQWFVWGVVLGFVLGWVGLDFLYSPPFPGHQCLIMSKKLLRVKIFGTPVWMEV